ncbi:MAG: SAM-dependent methyltransferase, partial [Gammaproteobacteria bacterium]|nr:SAM-dependent methyltransferase [Gammaproteobacteria bacterium]
MAKTGSDSQPGTAEGAALGRALHSRHAQDPVLDDSWAIHLLSPENRELVLASRDEAAMQMLEGFDASPIFAVNVGCLRYAEDEVERCIASGISQYLVLGAGLDSFALRRADLSQEVAVFEVDHPDMQALKRQRIAEAAQEPAMLPAFIAVDFECDKLAEKISCSDFDSSKPAVVSWLNTVHYLSEDATSATLQELAQLLAPGSRLILNYSVDVALTEPQLAFITQLFKVTQATGEPFKSRWTPAAFETLLNSNGFSVIEHATEDDLGRRYFDSRSD